jgi:hypothetical protein
MEAICYSETAGDFSTHYTAAWPISEVCITNIPGSSIKCNIHIMNISCLQRINMFSFYVCGVNKMATERPVTNVDPQHTYSSDLTL